MHPLLRWDRDALFWINGHHNALLDAVLAPVAYAGEMGTLWMLVILAMLIFGDSRIRKTALLLGVTMVVVDRVIGARLQHTFFRERPYLALEGIRHLGVQWKTGSFPSAHAHSVWVAVVILSSRWQRLAIPLVVFGLLTVYSRPYFGMHYPGDSLIGMLLGIAAGFAVLALERLWGHLTARRSKGGA